MLKYFNCIVSDLEKKMTKLPQNLLPKRNLEFEKKLKRIERTTIIGFRESILMQL